MDNTLKETLTRSAQSRLDLLETYGPTSLMIAEDSLSECEEAGLNIDEVEQVAKCLVELAKTQPLTLDALSFQLAQEQPKDDEE